MHSPARALHPHPTPPLIRVNDVFKVAVLKGLAEAPHLNTFFLPFPLLLSPIIKQIHIAYKTKVI